MPAQSVKTASYNAQCLYLITTELSHIMKEIYVV